MKNPLRHQHTWSGLTVEGSGILIIRCGDCGEEYQWVVDQEFGEPVHAAQYRSGIALTDGKSVQHLDSDGNLHPMYPA